MIIVRSKNPKMPGTIVTTTQGVGLLNFDKLDSNIQENITDVIQNEFQIKKESIVFVNHPRNPYIFIKTSKYNLSRKKILEDLGKLLHKNGLSSKKQKLFGPSKVQRLKYIENLDFREIFKRAKAFSSFLKTKQEEIALALEDFETYNVILDEIDRSVDHLENLDKNKEYFKKKVGGVTTFLPLNQPLYATICFGVVPSLMSDNCHVRPPTAVHDTFRKLDEVIKLNTFFPNLYISYSQKKDFCKRRKKNTDVVIFTGTSENGNHIYKELKPALFILNGSGHNPLIVTATGNISVSVNSTIKVCLQNQGQDCAAPNSILVEESILNEYLSQLKTELDKIRTRVGDYKDRKNVIGPNTEAKHLIKISRTFIELGKYLYYVGDMNPATKIITPTVFVKPLKHGPQLEEFFAPVIMIQPYSNDDELSIYFENPHYFSNAMYITIFGKSHYIESAEIISKLHSKESILYNTDLHSEERGFLPYGGRGYAASCIFYQGKRICGATLPQRDIYNYLIK